MKNKNNNNAVYILMGNGGWESDDVLGVYDSKAKATAAAKKYAAKAKADVENGTYDLNDYTDGYYIMEKTVNAAANDNNILRMAKNCTTVEL
jgi:hypothetical protein